MVKPLSDMSLEELWRLFPVTLEPHNPQWQDWYMQESESIRKLLPKGSVNTISHIGSTAINGIWAKPIIDNLKV